MDEQHFDHREITRLISGAETSGQALREQLERYNQELDTARKNAEKQHIDWHVDANKPVEDIRRLLKQKQHDLSRTGIQTSSQPNVQLSILDIPARQGLLESKRKFLALDITLQEKIRSLEALREDEKRTRKQQQRLFVGLGIVAVLVVLVFLQWSVNNASRVQIATQSSEVHAANQAGAAAQQATQVVVVVHTETTGFAQSRALQPTDTSRPSAARPTAIPTRLNCAGLITPRLVIGRLGQVTSGAANNIRDSHATSANRIGRIPGGAQFTVLEGPECDDGYVWWRVNYEGLIGWTAEGGTDYFLIPIEGTTNTSVTRRDTTAAYQRFEGGYMIWLSYNDQIYVLLGTGQYMVIGDTYSDGYVDQTIGIQPPTLRFEPVRGFGIVWHGDANVRDILGWALHLETGYSARTTYNTADGIMTISGPEQQFFTLFADGRWDGG